MRHTVSRLSLPSENKQFAMTMSCRMEPRCARNSATLEEVRRGFNNGLEHVGVRMEAMRAALIAPLMNGACFCTLRMHGLRYTDNQATKLLPKR